MSLTRISIPVYVPGKVYYILRKIKRKLCPPQEKPINLLGDRSIEWSWISAHVSLGTGEVLDFGCGESYMGLFAALCGFNVTAIDARPVHWLYLHPRLTFIQGDLFQLPLADSHFDLIINCSSVEHIGLRGPCSANDDMVDGDLEAMGRLGKLMKPGGVMLLTIPVGQDALFAPICRVYGRQRLPRLLQGYTVKEESFWIKDSQNRWIITDKETALNFQASAGSYNPLQNVFALGCFVLVK